MKTADTKILPRKRRLMLRAPDDVVDWLEKKSADRRPSVSVSRTILEVLVEKMDEEAGRRSNGVRR